MSNQPQIFENVSVVAKANVYFEGRVVSHVVNFPDGSQKSLGFIQPGSYHFGTGVAERMEVTHGSCQVTLDGSNETKTYTAGSSFDVPANSGFTIVVADEHTEYICSYLEA